MTDEDRVNALLDTKHFTPRQARFVPEGPAACRRGRSAAVFPVRWHRPWRGHPRLLQGAGHEAARHRLSLRPRQRAALPLSQSDVVRPNRRAEQPLSETRECARALERLMILDAVLATPSQQWFAASETRSSASSSGTTSPSPTCREALSDRAQTRLSGSSSTSSPSASAP